MKHLHRFFSSDASGGIILIIAAALAMLMANVGLTSGWYHAFLETPVQLKVGALEINKNMLLWINDALMAVFFLLIGLEVKREMNQGALASRRQAVFPVVAAHNAIFVAPTLYAHDFYSDESIVEIGRMDNVMEEYHAIFAERMIQHPAVQRICNRDYSALFTPPQA